MLPFIPRKYNIYRFRDLEASSTLRNVSKEFFKDVALIQMFFWHLTSNTSVSLIGRMFNDALLTITLRIFNYDDYCKGNNVDYGNNYGMIMIVMIIMTMGIDSLSLSV